MICSTLAIACVGRWWVSLPRSILQLGVFYTLMLQPIQHGCSTSNCQARPFSFLLFELTGASHNAVSVARHAYEDWMTASDLTFSQSLVCFHLSPWCLRDAWEISFWPFLPVVPSRLVHPLPPDAPFPTASSLASERGSQRSRVVGGGPLFFAVVPGAGTKWNSPRKFRNSSKTLSQKEFWFKQWFRAISKISRTISNFWGFAPGLFLIFWVFHRDYF